MSRQAGLFTTLHHLVAAHLAWVDRCSRTRPRMVLGGSLLLILVSLVSLLTLRFETDIFRLFPADRPALRLLLDSLEWSGGARDAYFLLEGEPDQLPAAAEQLAEKLRALQVDGAPGFKRVVYRIYEESEAQKFVDLVAFAARHPAAFVPLDDLPALQARLTPPAIDQALDQLTVQLAGSIGASAVALSQADPLGLRDLILPRLKAGSQALDLDPDSPYFMSRDQRVLIMIAEPAQPVQQMAFARKLVAGINQAREGAVVQISCAGAHISAVIDEAAMKANILACIGSSLLVVTGIFFAMYRTLWPTLMIPLFVSLGVITALGSAGLLVSSIHIISFAFMALVIGLGADYSIHLYDRFHWERTRGASTDQAISLAVADTGQGLFIAAASTALPFLAMAGAEVRALSELGLLVGRGVLFTLYANLFLMPLLLRRIDTGKRCYHPLPSLGLAGLWRFAGRHAGLLLCCAALLVVLFGLFARNSSFDVELKNLQPQHSEAFRAQELVAQHLNLAPKSMLVAVDGASQAEVLQHNQAVASLVGGLAANGSLQAWSNLGQTMNSHADQQAMVAQLPPSTGVATQLQRQLHAKGFSVAAFEPYLQHLQAGSLGQLLDDDVIIKQLSASPLRSVVERHLVQDQSGWHALTYLYFKPGQLQPADLVRDLGAALPAARVTGTDLVSQELLAAVRNSAINGIGLGSLLVLVLLVVQLRSLAGIGVALGPVLFGIVAMLGTMALVGMKFNFMNIMVLVTIVGMGCDYGMHVRHRCHGVDADQQGEAFVQAGRSILLSAVTTIAGFGSLALTDYGAMASIGQAANLGIFFTALAALVLVPAALNHAVFRR
ncbi:MAG: RND transporter [Geobacter sp.]|nr:RND transporter [Geobacter sp.]